MSVTFWIDGEINNEDSPTINMHNLNTSIFLGILDLPTDELVGDIRPSVFCDKAEVVLYDFQVKDRILCRDDGYWQHRGEEFLSMCLEAKLMGSRICYG